MKGFSSRPCLYWRIEVAKPGPDHVCLHTHTCVCVHEQVHTWPTSTHSYHRYTHTHVLAIASALFAAKSMTRGHGARKHSDISEKKSSLLPTDAAEVDYLARVSMVN